MTKQTSLKTRDFNGEAPQLLVPLAALALYAFAAGPAAADKSRSPARAVGGFLFALGALIVVFVGLLVAPVLAGGRLEAKSLAVMAAFLWLLGAIPALFLGVVFTVLSRRPQHA